jgi:hypothetical protein
MRAIHATAVVGGGGGDTAVAIAPADDEPEACRCCFAGLDGCDGRVGGTRVTTGMSTMKTATSSPMW